jgi:hypothetical protein
MAQAVAHCDPLGCNRIVQTKLGNVVAHRLGPETPLIVQERHAGRGE